MKTINVFILVISLLFIPLTGAADNNYQSYQSTITSVGAVSVSSQSSQEQSVSAPSFAFGTTSSMLGSGRGRMLLPSPPNWGEPGTQDEDGDPEFWTDPGDASSPVGEIPWFGLLLLMAAYICFKSSKSSIAKN